MTDHPKYLLASGIVAKASGFADAAERLASTFRDWDEITLHLPLNVLLFHAAELTLKSMIQLHRNPPKHHRLAELATMADELSLELHPDFRGFVRAHDDPNQAMTFRYGGQGYKMVSHRSALRRIRLQIAIAQALITKAS